jgi:hypothetical protein
MVVIECDIANNFEASKHLAIRMQASMTYRIATISKVACRIKIFDMNKLLVLKFQSRHHLKKEAPQGSSTFENTVSFSNKYPDKKLHIFMAPMRYRKKTMKLVNSHSYI